MAEPLNVGLRYAGRPVFQLDGKFYYYLVSKHKTNFNMYKGVR